MKELRLIGLIITGIGAILTASMLAIVLYANAQSGYNIPIVPGLLMYFGIATLIVGIITLAVALIGARTKRRNNSPLPRTSPNPRT